MRPSTIHISADFDHDGRPDPHGLPQDSASRFVIVLPVAHPSQGGDTRADCTFDGIHPAEAGIVEIQIADPLPASARFLVLTVDDDARGRVHLYRRHKSEWEPLGAQDVWSIELPSECAVSLGIVAGTFAGDRLDAQRRWDGCFTLSVSVADDGGQILAAEHIPCQIAPLMLTSALDPVEKVLVVDNDMTARFVEALRHIVPQTGASLCTIQTGTATGSDIWMQDTVEIGRVCAPCRQGIVQGVVVLSGLRALHDDFPCEPLDRIARQHLFDMGAVIVDAAAPRQGTRWIDWYGNLEVSPPVTAQNGRAFPYGRILVGRQNELSMHPDLLAFLEMQGIQVPPLVIDTSWLKIGHVDEVVNFVPAPDGFRILVPSPARARGILESLVRRGAGQTAVFEGHKGETTVETLLEQVALSPESKQIDQTLQTVKACLCDGLGVCNDHLIDIPVLFQDGIAVIPNGVNSLVCNGHAIIPDPVGPICDGVDAFAAPIQAALTGLGLTVHFVDIWEPYHLWRGEIHCGTNAIRRLRHGSWWEMAAKQKSCTR